MILPAHIKKNDTIALVAPSGKTDHETIVYAQQFLVNLGYKVIIGKHAEATFHQFAGTDTQRAADLQEMLDHPVVKAIFAIRGGYGCIRIIDRLDFTRFINHPKWLVGFSDITVLHACLQNKHGISSIHGLMPKNYPNKTADDIEVKELFNILTGQLPSYSISPHPLNRLGTSNGLLTGGNLTLLQTLRGTPYDFNPKGKVLFIEDLGEYLYHLDRLMHNLKVGNILSQLNGLVVGQFSDMKDNDSPFGLDTYEIIKEAVAEYDYPVLFNFPAGHTNINYPLVFGQEVSLEITQQSAKLMF